MRIFSHCRPLQAVWRRCRASSNSKGRPTTGPGYDLVFSVFVFDPEENRGGEIGIKTSLLENSMLATVEVYYCKFSDLQVDFFNDAQFALVASNAGGSEPVTALP